MIEKTAERPNTFFDFEKVKKYTVVQNVVVFHTLCGLFLVFSIEHIQISCSAILQREFFTCFGGIDSIVRIHGIYSRSELRL